MYDPCEEKDRSRPHSQKTCWGGEAAWIDLLLDVLEQVVTRDVPVYVEKQVPVERFVEVPTDRIVPVERLVEVPTERRVEVPVERTVEVPVERIVDRPVYVEKEVPVHIEREVPVYVDREVPVERATAPAPPQYEPVYETRHRRVQVRLADPGCQDLEIYCSGECKF